MITALCIVIVVSTDAVFAAGVGSEMFGLFDRPVSPNPIGFIGGEPLWSRVYERADGSANIAFDNDNAAYLVNHRRYPFENPPLEGDMKRVTAMKANIELGRYERLSVRNLRRKLNMRYL
ncbi:hypothetical protein PFISCL1PPCAC_13422 [Pristionchus fissidentatus]|uniref:Uncharacterized protein n=1 Tax=Pristionchus fissidentatus TaxID=1538716 RepID=A0AAV5VVP6_9BILA|nr:hypothetical protein PFISCL1PPCAC_13422 [Pristionchus fissidentatus]